MPADAQRLVNQVEGHSEICAKARLAENMRKYAIERKASCPWIPETHVLTAGMQNGGLWRPSGGHENSTWVQGHGRQTAGLQTGGSMQAHYIARTQAAVTARDVCPDCWPAA